MLPEGKIWVYASNKTVPTSRICIKAIVQDYDDDDEWEYFYNVGNNWYLVRVRYDDVYLLRRIKWIDKEQQE